MEYVLLTLSSVLLAVNFIFSDLYQRKAGTGLVSGLTYSSLVGVFTAIIWVVVCIIGGAPLFPLKWYSVLFSLARTALCIIYTLVGFRVIRMGGVALYTLFLMAGGMLLPYFWGLLFLGEAFSVWAFLGTLLIVASIVITALGADRPDWKQLVMLIFIFVCNGFVSVLSKIHQIQPAEMIVASEPFTVYNSVSSALLAGAAAFAIFLVEKRKAKTAGGVAAPDVSGPAEKKKFPLSMILVMLGSASIGGVSSFLLIDAATSVPATALYPFSTGGTIVLTALAGLIVFGERPSTKKWISIGIALVGTCLFLFS